MCFPHSCASLATACFSERIQLVSKVPWVPRSEAAPHGKPFHPIPYPTGASPQIWGKLPLSAGFVLVSGFNIVIFHVSSQLHLSPSSACISPSSDRVVSHLEHHTPPL